MKDFRWLTQSEMDTLELNSMSDNQDTGYILEVDLAYPKALHKAHSSFPLAPERLIINEEMLSPYAAGIYSPIKHVHM